MRRLLLIVSLLLVFSATPALAVTDGETRRGRTSHGRPHGGVRRRTENPLWRCSGTMILRVCLPDGRTLHRWPRPRHRSGSTPDVQNGTPDNGYGKDGGWSGDVSGAYVRASALRPGTVVAADVGVVVLDEPYGGPVASLPDEDQLDKFASKAKKNKAWFTAVGYGLQKAFPDAAAWKDVADKIRMVSYPKLIQINVPGSTGDKTLLLSNNAHTGGTCFGDSGGPNFLKEHADGRRRHLVRQERHMCRPGRRLPHRSG